MIHKIISSFNSGELSPLMESRHGVEKVESGCRRLRNFIPTTQGPVFRRGGLEYRAAARSHSKRSRLAPFNFSTATSAILEFSPLGFRVIQNGAVVALVEDVSLPFSEQDCFEVQMVQVNDVVYLAHANHHPMKLIRLASNRWVLDHLFRGLIEASSPTTVDLSAGAQGKARMDYWTAFTVTADVDGMLADSQLLDPPDGGQDITDLSPPLVPTAGPYMRKITGNLTVPTSGSWTIAMPYNARGRIYVDGVEKLTVGQGEASASFVIDLVAGQEYSLVLWNWLNTGAQDFAVRISGPSFALQVVPSSMLSKVDAYSGGLYNPSDFGNAWPAMLDQNITPTTIAVDAVTGSGVTATATEPVFVPGHVGSFWQIAHTRAASTTEVVGSVGAFTGTSAELTVLGGWDLFTYGTWAGTLYLERQNGASWDVVRTWKGNKDRNIVTSGSEDVTAVLRLRVASGDGEAASGASVPRFLLEAADARIYGLIYITAVSNDGLTATADVSKDLWSTDATPLWSEGAWSEERGYPRAVALHKGSMFYGGTRSHPGRLWKSAAGDWENFRLSSAGDGAIDITLAAEEANSIQWMVSQARSLLIGTGGEEWTLSPSSGEVINALTASVERQSRYGSNYLPAQIVNDVPVFVQRGGRKLRKLLYSNADEKYGSGDLTVLAEHITVSGIQQLAFQSQKSAILWAVTGDGRLLGMTHETEQNVFAWHVHSTDGEIESAAVIYGDGTDEVWCIVRRTVDGGDRRFIERLDPVAMEQDFSAPANLNYLDSSRHHIFTSPGTVVPGLEHLEGRTVSVLVDGAVHPDRVVSSGAIVLQAPGTHVIAGLPFVSLLQPMRQEFQMQDGTAQGRVVKCARVTVRYLDSSGGQASDNPDNPDAQWEQIVNRSAPATMGAALPLATDEQTLTLSAKHRRSVDVAVRQNAPLPLTIGALILECDVYQST